MSESSQNSSIKTDRQKSGIWDYFTEVENKTKAKCDFCDTHIAKCQNASNDAKTRAQELIDLNNVRNAKRPKPSKDETSINNGNTNFHVMTDEERQNANELLGKFIFTSAIAFAIVGNP